MNETINCIMNRRSIRKYTKRQVGENELKQILDAALYAPSAGGRQGVLLVVCQNAEINDALGRANKAAFNGSYSTDTVYISKQQPSIADSPLIKSGFYGAPTVVTLFGVRNFLYADQDCAVAAENMQIAAESLGVASCMLGRAQETFATPLGHSLLEKYNFPRGYIPVCHVLLGYIDGPAPTAKPRRENRVIIMEQVKWIWKPVLKNLNTLARFRWPQRMKTVRRKYAA